MAPPSPAAPLVDGVEAPSHAPTRANAPSTTATLLAATVNIGGYPGDKPSGTFWFDSRAVGSVKPEKVFYAADTAGGQSGACVYIVKNRKRVGVAVHAYGGATANSGTRISQDVFVNLTAWKRT